MRFFETILSGAAMIAAVAAVTIDQYPTGGVQAGQTYTITYSPKTDAPTTFILRQGESTNLDTVATLTTTATGGSFSWTVPSDLVDEPDYALEVRQGTEVNYSGQFPISGGTGSAVSSAVSSAAYSASSAVASAASSASSAAASAASSVSTSLGSALSSAVASITSVQASATISPSAGMNSTVTSVTLSRTGSVKPTSTASTTGSAPPESTGAASSLSGSPLVVLLGAVAAFAYLA